MYVLDTNTLIYFFKGAGSVGKNLLSRSPKEIGLPAPVVYEVEFIISRTTEARHRLKQLLDITSLINILPFTEKEAEISSAIRSELEAKNASLGHFDILAASSALRHRATLVTHNTAAFQQIKALKFEDWY